MNHFLCWVASEPSRTFFFILFNSWETQHGFTTFLPQSHYGFTIWNISRFFWMIHDDSFMMIHRTKVFFSQAEVLDAAMRRPLWFPDIFTKNELVCSRCEVAITHQDLHENANTKDSLHRFLNIEDAGVYEPTCEGSNRSNIWLCHIVPHFPASVLHIGIIRHGKYWLLSYLVAHPRNRGCFFLPPLNSVALG